MSPQRRNFNYRTGEDMAFRIAQISDTHLSTAKPYFVENFLRLSDVLRHEAPNLVIT